MVEDLSNADRNGYSFRLLDTKVDVIPFGVIEEPDRTLL